MLLKLKLVMVNYSIFRIGNLMLYFSELKQKQIVRKILRALPRVWIGCRNRRFLYSQIALFLNLFELA